MRKIIKEFSDFIKRGNVLDLSVGIIVGGAFTAIVTALSNGILKPFINWIIALCSGGDADALAAAVTMLRPAYAADGTIDLANSIYIDWGAFISAIINFFLIAFVLFCIVKAINKVQEEHDKAVSDYKKLTKEDRKELKKRGIKLYDADKVKAFVEEKEKIANEKAEEEKKLAEEQAKKERELNPTETDLLKKIVELLEQKR